MDLLALLLIVILILFVAGGFALTHLLWIIAVVALIVLVARFVLGARL